MELLSQIEILQVAHPDAAEPCQRAANFAAQLARKAGAKVFVSDSCDHDPEAFHGRGKQLLEGDVSLTAWLAEGENRILMLANTDDGFSELLANTSLSIVEVNMPAWHSESTLFAECGLAQLLGDPNREPLVSAGNYASGAIGYAVYTSLMGVIAKRTRYDQGEVARVNGLSALSWINWKAAAVGAMPNADDYLREGEQAEWPILPCKDGFVAFLFLERDWDAIVKVIGHPDLEQERFATFASRAENRDAYMDIVRDWASKITKKEFMQMCYETGIPGAPVLTIGDVLEDDLFLHRDAFEEVTSGDGRTLQSPVAPHRVEGEYSNQDQLVEDSVDGLDGREGAPLAGKRILDLGIITAGAGTTGLLADLGAEVIKVESETYPDPFRLWAGADSESPLFAFNNRNKYAVAIDLKTEKGKKDFFKLVESADAVVENFRRGVLPRLGITLETLKEHNPNILLASVSGQGASGPYSDHATFGSTLEANSGFSALTAYDDVGLPYITGRQVNFPDQTVCFYGASMIAAGMMACKRDNKCMHVDISQRDVAMYIAGDAIEFVSGGGDDDLVAIRNHLNSHVFDEVLTTADGQWLVVALRDFAQLDSVSGLSEASAAGIRQWVAERTAEDAQSVLQKSGISSVKALLGSEMFRHPDVVANRVFSKAPSGMMVKGFAFTLANSPLAIWNNSPGVGEHSDLYLAA